MYTPTARRIGIYSAVGLLCVQIAYAITLVIGFLSLESPELPIGNPMFTILEILIIAMMPAMVLLMVSVHAWAPLHLKALSLASVVFISLLSCITCSLHFVILTLSRQPEFIELSTLPLFLSFSWPSVAYALDIVAWDFFFALSMLLAAPVFTGSALARSIRLLMIFSGVLALAGLSGVVYGDMQLRNIGIVGYLGVFMVVVVLLLVLFCHSDPVTS